MSGRVILLRASEDNPRKSTIVVIPFISDYEVQLNLPIIGVGKVKQGQRVQIKLDPYPVNEFGYLEGRIEAVIPYAIENNYRAIVHLNNGMKTTNGKTIVTIVGNNLAFIEYLSIFIINSQLARKTELLLRINVLRCIIIGLGCLGKTLVFSLHTTGKGFKQYGYLKNYYGALFLMSIKDKMFKTFLKAHIV